MTRIGAKTTERINPEQWFSSREEYLLYLRHLFAYEFARTLIGPSDSVLEVGSGEGYGAKMLSATASRVVGLDVDPVSVQAATAKYDSDKLSFRHYDGHSIPFEESAFDFVVSFQVIEHVQDVPFYLSEIRRVLRPKGTLLLTTPNRVYRLKPGQKPWNRFHLREYDAPELAAVLVGSFPGAAVRGVRGTDEVQAIEKARVAWALKSGPAGALRRNMPEPMRRLAGRILGLSGRKRRSGETPDFLTRYSTSDYSVTEKEVDQSLDLLAVCGKA